MIPQPLKIGLPARSKVTTQPSGRVPTAVVVVVDRQADLLEVVGALDAAGRLAGRLHGRQEQGDQHGDDRDDHQQLDQRETTTLAHYQNPPVIVTMDAARADPFGKGRA